MLMTCKTQEEILQNFLIELDYDKYIKIPLKFTVFEGERNDEIDTYIYKSGRDDVYTSWHLIKGALPLINNSGPLSKFKDKLIFSKQRVQYRNENRKVVYNNKMIREFNAFHKKKYNISIYDKIKSDLDCIINLIDFISYEIEKRIDEIGESHLIECAKPMGLEFAKSQTKSVAAMLILENYGLFYQPEEQKPLNKIFDGAKFPVKGELKDPADLPAVRSKMRNGHHQLRFKSLNKKVKKALKQAALEFIESLESDDVNIYQK